jgi:hypothetical protein
MATVTAKEIREMADDWGRIMIELGPGLKQAEAIKKNIFAWLKTNGKLVEIDGDVAVAKRFEKFGDREIGLMEFFDAAAKKTQGERNECLKVEIKKAEVLLGKAAVDKISNRPTVRSNSLELK